MELEQSARAQARRELRQPPGTNEQRQETEQKPVKRPQSRGALSRASDDDELVLYKEILGHQRLGASVAAEPGDGGQTVDEEYHERLHWPEFRSLRPPGQDCQVTDFSTV